MKLRTWRSDFSLIDALEPRLVLSGPPPYPFVTAGISFDTATNQASGMFWASGTVYADDSFTGSYERFDATSRSGPGALPWAGFTRPDTDRMRLLPAAGFDGYASQNSLQFIAQQGFPPGSFVGRDSAGIVRDMGMFVEPYFQGPFGLGVYLQQDYFITTFAAMTPERGLETVTLVATPHYFKSPDYTFEYFFQSGTVEFDNVHVVSATPTLTVFDNGVRVYSTNSHATNFFMVDPDGSDGIVGFGVGLVRWAQAPDSIHVDDIHGAYRGSIMTSGPESGAFFGIQNTAGGLSGDAVADVVIAIDPDGAFTVYDAGAYDQGLRNPVNSGRWAYLANPRQRHDLDLGRLQLTDWDGRVAAVRVARNALLIPVSVAGLQAASTESGEFEEVWGIVTRGSYTPITDALDFQEAVFSTDEAGHLVALQHAISSDADKVGWYSLDLTDSFGTAAVTGSLYSWHDLNFERVAVVGRSVGGDLLFWQRLNDEWTFEDLTTAIDGAVAFGGDISGVNFANGDFFRRPLAAIVGTDADGKFIAYVQQEGAAWEFVNVEANGLVGEGVHPNFVGPLAGFGTPWDGFNFAGLDDQGRIWALWYSRALGGHWATNNLSEIAGGTPQIVSHLTAITTPWNAFQISGLDSRGHIIVTWWAREVGWRYDGLTDLVGGPSFVGVELASYYSIALNVINVIGIDAAGDAVVYWWNPKSGWNVGYPATGLSESTRPQGAILYDGFDVRYSNIPGQSASFQSITWQAADGHTKRLVWYTAAPDAWSFEDLTELAKPL